MDRGAIAAAIHRRMVEDDRFGYSWEERWGHEDERWTVGGLEFPMAVGDYDCSSSCIRAWDRAMTGTRYEGVLDRATYTGNIRSVFVGSGLFEWKPISFIASPGDLYLNEANHVAMCQRQVPDELSEFSWGDNGAYGNQRGDQSGYEARVNPYYDYPWDGILHYNGKADINTVKDAARLYGIDVSSNQPERIVRNVVNDFAIVKMGGNPQDYTWNYVNPYAKQQAKDVMDKHGLLGLYWFTWGKQASVEADFFVEQVEKLGYLGKAMLVIDYEAQAVGKGQTWVKKFADRVKERAGYAPVIYASGSVIVDQNLFSLGYPIWCASYYKGYDRIDGYDTSGMKIYGGCEKSVMWQFTSQGYLSGYDGPLDLDVFFGGRADFQTLMGPKQAAKPAQPAEAPAAAAKLAVDGQWGKLTTKELQRQLGVTVTGRLNAMTYQALQKRLKVTADGYFGPVSKKALQKKLGVTADGYIGPVTVKALQRALNAGKVAKW